MIKNLYKYLLLQLICLASSQVSAKFNLGDWNAFNKGTKKSLSAEIHTTTLSKSMLTGTFTCGLTGTNANCLTTTEYLPNLQNAVSLGQLAPTLFCFTYTLNGLDVTDIYQTQYCNGFPLPPDVIVQAISVQTYSIAGNSSVLPNSNVTYNYGSPNPTSYFSWYVQGGFIVSGQGTNTITVNWGVEGAGNVGVVEFEDGVCPGPSVCLGISIGNIPVVYGCVNPDACNFNPLATIDDGSCTLPGCLDFTACNYSAFAGCAAECIYQSITFLDCNGNCINDSDNDGLCDEQEGTTCMDSSACNYDPSDIDPSDDICIYGGCTEPAACNYTSFAACNDGSCIFPGCQDIIACNFDITAGCEGPCEYQTISFLNCEGNCINDSDGDGICNENETAGGCTNSMACNYDPSDFNPNDDDCIFGAGCANPSACNYNLNALCDDGSCVFPGCMDPAANNYDENAGCNDGSCVYNGLPGCMDTTACNYDENATLNDGSCSFLEPGIISGNSNPTAGNTINYSTPSIANVTFAWQASGSGNITGPNNQNNVSVQWNSGGNNTLSLTLNNGECEITSYLNVNVDCSFGTLSILGDTNVSANITSEEIYSITLLQNVTYNWSVFPINAGNTISGQNTNSVQVQWGNNAPNEEAELQLIVSSAGCTDTANLIIHFVTPIGVENSTFELEPVIFPNPANEAITIAGIDASANLTYHISDLSGRWVASGVLRNAQINLNDLAASTYLLELRSNGLPIARNRFIKN